MYVSHIAASADNYIERKKIEEKKEIRAESNAKAFIFTNKTHCISHAKAKNQEPISLQWFQVVISSLYYQIKMHQL